MSTKPYYTQSQINTQLTTSWGGSYTGYTMTWASKLSTISFSINSGVPTNSGGTPVEGSGYVAMDAVQVAAARLGFQLWDDLIARHLVESTSPSAKITLDYSSNTNGDGTYTSMFAGSVKAQAHSVNLGAAQVWLSSDWSSNQDSGMAPGGYGLLTMIHEIGHSLGLSHPGLYNGSATYANDAVFAQDNREYTVMSYFGGYDPAINNWQQDGTTLAYLYPQTPMVYDISAIQALYGADMTTRATDTIYGFNCNLLASNTEKAIYDFSLNHVPIFSIWDGGGRDTFDCSGYAGSQTIDLKPGDYSSVDGMNGNVGIAFNCTIEDAVGGLGIDTIYGNSAANSLNGGAGDDIIYGSSNDTLIGGAGNDTLISDTGSSAKYMYGGGGDDTYYLSSSSDKVIENAGEGHDRVTVQFSFSIKTLLNVEDLFKDSRGTSGLTLEGNDGNNWITGTGHDTLIGGSGSDTLDCSGYGSSGVSGSTLYGGNGNDTLTGSQSADYFVFNTAPNASTNHDTITNFQQGIDKIEFSLAVYSALGSVPRVLSSDQFWSGGGAQSGHLASDRVIYDTTSGELYYDSDGSGAALAVSVALIGTVTHPTLTAADVLLIA
jgi:serralysin